jgi:hypothetical protein
MPKKTDGIGPYSTGKDGSNKYGTHDNIGTRPSQGFRPFVGPNKPDATTREAEKMSGVGSKLSGKSPEAIARAAKKLQGEG